MSTLLAGTGRHSPARSSLSLPTPASRRPLTQAAVLVALAVVTAVVVWGAVGFCEGGAAGQGRATRGLVRTACGCAAGRGQPDQNSRHMQPTWPPNHPAHGRGTRSSGGRARGSGGGRRGSRHRGSSGLRRGKGRGGCEACGSSSHYSSSSPCLRPLSITQAAAVAA